MTLRRADNGGLYGTAPVILAKEENSEINFLIGSAAPFGGIMVTEEYKGNRFTEKPHSWWQKEGFSITEAKELELARDLSTERLHSKTAEL